MFHQSETLNWTVEQVSTEFGMMDSQYLTAQAIVVALRKLVQVPEGIFMGQKLNIKACLRILAAALAMFSAVGMGAYAQDVSQDVSEEQRVDHYMRLTQVDPLYAWPAVDLDNMEKAILALEISRAEILAFADQYSDDQRARISIALYPTAYLTEMVAFERQRRALSDDAGKDKLNAYQSQLLRTIEAHQSYLSDLQAALNATASEVSYKGLEYHFGRSSFAHFIAGIEACRVDAAQSREQAERRWKCLGTETPGCETPVWSVVPGPKDIEFTFEIFEQPPARITKAIREHGRLGGKAAGPGWAMLNKSDCDAGDTPVPFLIWEFPTASGVPVFRPEVVNDVLVHDHQIDEDSNAYERILDSLGMEGFLFQSHTNLYACPDAARDSAKLRSMVYIYEFAGQFDWQDPQTDEETPSAAFAQVSRAASTLRSAPVLTENAVQAFVHEVTNLLAGFERDDLMAALGTDRVNRRVKWVHVAA